MSSSNSNSKDCHPLNRWRTTPALYVALLLVLRSSHGAESPASIGSPLVSGLSRKEALVFEGNRTFTKERILEEMAFHLDYHVAAHRAAPLPDYIARLERKITLGYQNEGFPDVKVKATADTNAHRVVVRVDEGPRYKCGEILLSGVPTMTNAAVKQKISEKLGGFQTGSTQQTNWGAAPWRRHAPAPFGEFAQQGFKELVQEALADLDYFQPKVSVQIVPDPARKLADLKVEIADEGIKGTIEEITVTGLRTNTPQQVLDFLKLRRGMELHVNLVNTVSNQLWNSARFFHQDARLTPLPAVGRFKLELDLEELRATPPLSQELPPEAKALLKFRAWLMDWRRRPEDLVYSMSLTTAWARVQSDLVLSPSGFVLTARADSSNGPPLLKYAVVATPELLGFYSPWRQRKFVVARTEGGAKVAAFIEVSPDPQARADQKFRVTFGAGFNSPEGSQPVELNMKLAPVALVSDAARLKKTMQGGVLTVRDTNTLENVLFEFKIEAATGRAQGTVEGKEGSVHLRPEEGAFTRVLKEIAAATANHPNDYVTNHGFSSWVSFVATDFIEASLGDVLLQAWLKNSAEGDLSTNALATVRQVRSAAALARQLVGQESLARLLEPLNRLYSSKSDDDEDQECFDAPRDISLRGVDPNMAGYAAFALALSDVLVPPDSWLWVLLRETAFTLAGQGRYTETELNALLKSNDVGPAGALATALLVRRMDPRLARTFAERGLSRLTASEFQKDYRIWLDTNSIVGEMSANALGLFRDLKEDQVTALTAGLPPDEAAFVRSLARRIRDAKDQPAADAAWPAVEQHWDKALRRYLELGLNHFLPQVQFLTDPKALFARGLKLSAQDAVMRDFDEAAQCFRKAAEQGHAGAQLYLGHLYETGRGVREDFAEAMRWYRKAAEQKEPHAACAIAQLYRDGKGVDKDLDKAAEWYRRELAEHRECPNAEHSLGVMCEMQRNWDEALSLYRRAAEGGHTAAQAHLVQQHIDYVT